MRSASRPGHSVTHVRIGKIYIEAGEQCGAISSRLVYPPDTRIACHQYCTVDLHQSSLV
jgi:hypothetical protein